MTLGDEVGAHAGASLKRRHNSRSDCLIIKSLFPPQLDEVGNITLRRQLGKANHANLVGNAIECSTDDRLVLLALLVIVAENEDATVLEVWR